jgi:hypothetical protein
MISSILLRFNIILFIKTQIVIYIEKMIKREDKFPEICHWFFFSLMCSLFPIIMALIMGKIGSPKQHIIKVLIEQISHGEVFLTCISSLSFAIGELIQQGTRNDYHRTILAGSCLVLFLFSATLFGVVASNAHFTLINETFSNEYIAIVSLAIFGGTLLSCVAVIYLPKK